MAAIVKRDELGYTHITGITTTQLIALANAILNASAEDQEELLPIAEGIISVARRITAELEAGCSRMDRLIKEHSNKNSI